MTVSVITLNQDFPTVAALQVTQVQHPEGYTLYLFLYSDWQIGNQSSIYAKGQTSLNADGSWQTPICVLEGTYNVVVTNGVTTCVIASHLSI